MPIDRRRFLKCSALAAAPAFARSALGPLFAQGAEYPVVVIGAGLAGLQAADVLRRAGRPVVVFEGRGEPGGRVVTLRNPFESGLYGEAGPIRIAPSHARVLRLVREHKLNLVPFDSSNGAPLVTVGGTSVRADALSRTPLPLDLKANERGKAQGALLEQYIGTLPRELSELSPSAAAWGRWAEYDRMSWPQWLTSRGASDAAVRLMTVGGDSRELSALYVLRQYALLRGTAQFYKIQGGMDLLPRALAASLEGFVRYGAPVTSIDQTGELVRVDYVEDDQYRSAYGTHVILTAPFSTFRQFDVVPAFSAEKQRIINELPYFPSTRFLLQARSRFWQGEGLSGYARSDQPMEIWDATYDQPGSSGLLCATVGGTIGRRMFNMSPEVCVRFGTELMAASFPGIRAQLQFGVAHQWAGDPWARGGFAVFHPGQMAGMMPAISRPEGRIHFAGEHTSPWMGWMEGALESGERVADEILKRS